MFDPPSQDKRRIQEEIAKKRRQIEEEKLKLQYIKVCLYFTAKKQKYPGENVSVCNSVYRECEELSHEGLMISFTVIFLHIFIDAVSELYFTDIYSLQ